MSKKTRSKKSKNKTLNKKYKPITYEDSIKAELNIRKRYGEWMGIDDPTKIEYAFFTDDELIEKYAKEFAFWSSEHHLDGFPEESIIFVEKQMAAHGFINTIKIIKKKFKDNDHMLKAIYLRSLEYHKEYCGKIMDDISQLLYCVDESKKQS